MKIARHAKAASRAKRARPAKVGQAREGGRPPGQGGGGKPGGERSSERREGGPPREGAREGRPEGRPGGDRDRGPRPGGGRFDFPPDIDLDKLIGDSLYLDNQAHVVVAACATWIPARAASCAAL